MNSSVSITEQEKEPHLVAKAINDMEIDLAIEEGDSAKEEKFENNAKRQAVDSVIEQLCKKTKPEGGAAIDVRNIDELSMVIPAQKQNEQFEYDPEFASLVDLSPVPDSDPPPVITDSERRMLERLLQLGDVQFSTFESRDGWREDWSGNLQLLDKEIWVNLNDSPEPHAKPVLKLFHEWVAETMSKSPQGLQGVRLLFHYVYHMRDTPEMAKRILAYALNRVAKDDNERLQFLINAVRRILHDPVVLKQDGWTTKKAISPEGASGGAFLIGKKVIWEKFEAIVIGFVHDDEIGDLWKAMWLEDRETFDLEADELWSAIKKWEAREVRKQTKQQLSSNNSLTDISEPQQQPQQRVAYSNHRHQQYADYTVRGIEHGIVLATSCHPNSRKGVFWPARVMHVSELNKTNSPREPGTRRGAGKRHVSVVFLAPYWNGQLASKGRLSGGGISTSVATAKSIYSTGPLFEIETIEPSETTILKYPYDDCNELSLDKVRDAFKFLGLPKAAFARNLDSHRLAIALKNYSKQCILDDRNIVVDAFSALTDCHQMSITTARYPSALLDVPYDYILSHLAETSEQASHWMKTDDVAERTEPVLQLGHILQSMCPPECFGKRPVSDNNTGSVNGISSQRKCLTTPKGSPCKGALTSDGKIIDTLSVDHFASDVLLRALGQGDEYSPLSPCLKLLGNHLTVLVSEVNDISADIIANVSLRRDIKKSKLDGITNECLAVKSFGEEIIGSIATPMDFSAKELVFEWRKACEKIYKHAIGLLSSPGFGNGVTVVITDSRCNQHLTTSGCFERPIRLPAAIRGAKKAGAGADVNLPLIYHITETYLDIAEKKNSTKSPQRTLP